MLSSFVALEQVSLSAPGVESEKKQRTGKTEGEAALVPAEGRCRDEVANLKSTLHSGLQGQDTGYRRLSICQ